MLAFQGEICDIDGTCVDAADDEIFKLTTKEGSLSMEREKVSHSEQSRGFCTCFRLLYLLYGSGNLANTTWLGSLSKGQLTSPALVFAMWHLQLLCTCC